MSFESLTKPRLEIYKSVNSKTNKTEFRWRIWILSNIVAASSEGYINRQDCIDNLLKIEQYIKKLREQNLIE